MSQWLSHLDPPRRTVGQVGVDTRHAPVGFFIWPSFVTDHLGLGSNSNLKEYFVAVSNCLQEEAKFDWKISLVLFQPHPLIAESALVPYDAMSHPEGTYPGSG